MNKRFLIMILMLLSGFGCSIQPRTTGGDPSLPLFVQVFEAPEAKRAQALAQMESEYPQSPWTLRAKHMNELLTTRDSLEKRIRDLEREKKSWSQENRALTGEADRLRQDLAKLRQILIDMEKRAIPR